MGVQPGGDQERGRQRRLAFERGASRRDQRLLTPSRPVGAERQIPRQCLDHPEGASEPGTGPCSSIRRTSCHNAPSTSTARLLAGRPPYGPPRRTFVFRLPGRCRCIGRSSSGSRSTHACSDSFDGRTGLDNTRPSPPRAERSGPGRPSEIVGTKIAPLPKPSDSSLGDERYRAVSARILASTRRSRSSSSRRNPRSTTRSPLCGSGS